MGWKWVDEGDGPQPNSQQPDGQATQQILNARQAGNMSVNTVAGANQFAQQQQAEMNSRAQDGGLGLWQQRAAAASAMQNAPASNATSAMDASRRQALGQPAAPAAQAQATSIGPGLFRSDAARIVGGIPAPGAAANMQGQAAAQAQNFGVGAKLGPGAAAGGQLDSTPNAYMRASQEAASNKQRLGLWG